MAYRPKDIQDRILHRLKITQGHLKKVIKMVEDDEYCIEILHQSQAIQKALREVDHLMLENHLKKCTHDAFSKGHQVHAIEEIISVFKKRN